MSSSLSSQGTDYYVHVSAYNMKGWGPPLIATPACAAPSSKSCAAVKGEKSVLNIRASGKCVLKLEEISLTSVCTPHTGVEKYLYSTSAVNLFHLTPVSADICMSVCLLDKIRNTKL